MVTTEIEVGVSGNNVMDLLGMPREKSVAELLDEAIQSKETALAQYERILYKMSMRRAELSEELNKLNQQFKQIEYLLDDTRKALNVLHGKPQAPAPSEQVSAIVTRERQRHSAGTTWQQIIDAFEGEEALGMDELSQKTGLTQITLRNFLARVKQDLLVVDPTVKFKRGSNARVFYKLNK